MRPILLVSDDPQDRTAVLKSLKRQKLANPVVPVATGEEAYKYLERYVAYRGHDEYIPAVVLLDLTVPRPGTMHLLQLLRFTPRFRPVPFVILSKSKEEEELMRAHDLGAIAYVAKPEDPRELSEVLETLWATLLKLDRKKGRGKG